MAHAPEIDEADVPEADEEPEPPKPPFQLGHHRLSRILSLLLSA